MGKITISPSGFLSERGRTHGVYESSNYINDIPELYEGNDYATYTKMRKGDSTVSAAMRSIELPIRKATFDIQPPSNPTDEEKTQAQVLASAIFEHLSWSDILRGAITYLTYGFSVHEFTLEYREGMILPKKIAFRPQNTIEELPTYENRDKRGNLKSLSQIVEGRRYTLPRKKLIICTADAESKENWRGTSILRSAYRPWFIKEKMELINAVANERWGVCIPVLEMPEITDSTTTFTPVEEPGQGDGTITQESQFTVNHRAAVKALQKLHGGEQSYAVLPFGYKLSILDRRSQAIDTLSYIRELKDDIKTAVLALHLRLGGNDTSGSKALGVAFVDSFLHAVESWANVICDAFNYDLLRPLIIMNWGEQKRYATMIVTNIYKTALQEIAYMIQAGVIKPTPELIRYIFDQFGIRIDAESAMPEPNRSPGSQEQEQEQEEENQND